MGKIVAKIHWLIIVWAIYNIATAYMDRQSKLDGFSELQEVQRASLLRVKKQKKEIKAFYKDINEAKDKIERVAREIEKTQQLLPSEVSDNENMTLLKKMAEDVNIKETQIIPENDDDRGFYIARRFKVKAKATYLQFVIIFEKIAENKRILNVLDLTFKKLEQPQRSKFQLLDGEFLIEAYRFNPNFKEDRGIEKIENDFKNGNVPIVIKPHVDKNGKGE